MKPTVSLCMIVRNEAANLAACLASVADLVDELVIVDTGSSDGTKAVAAQYRAQVFDFAWCDDFSAARNETLRHAHGDWIFWIDADDRLDEPNRQRLRQLFAKLGHETQNVVYAMQCLSRLPGPDNPGCWVTHTRLFPRTSGLRWHRRVHEQVSVDECSVGAEIRWTDVVIDHLGYQNPVQRRQKIRRDLRLLQLEFALNPDDSATLFYLGWTHLELGNLPNALRFLLRSQTRAPDLRKVYTLLAQCLAQMGRRDEAIRTCGQGLERFPHDTELLFHRGRLLGESGDLAGAEQCFLQLLRKPPEQYLQIGVEAGLRGPRVRFLLGLLYDEQGRSAEAEAQYRAALAENPDFASAWLGLGQLLLNLGRWNELAAAIQRLAQCPGGDLLAAVLHARVLTVQSQFAAAHRLLDPVLVQDPRMIWPRLVLSDLVVAEGADLETAIRVHREILELDSQQVAVQRRLDELLQRQRLAGQVPSHASAAASPMGGSVVLAAG